MTDAVEIGAGERQLVYKYLLLARTQFFIGKPKAAIETLSQGLSIFPGDAVLLRHRGHRLLTERRFAEAIDDFETAAATFESLPDEIEFYQAQVEEDLRHTVLGEHHVARAYPIYVTPESLLLYRDVYKGTLKASTWYHLGLAHYFRFEGEAAATALRRALEFCRDDDMTVATLDWLYLSLRKTRSDDEAEKVLRMVRDDMHVLERSYWTRLELYRGVIDPTEAFGRAKGSGNLATQVFGIGSWLLAEGRADEARRAFEYVIDSCKPDSFGFIGAELELGRLGGKRAVARDLSA